MRPLRRQGELETKGLLGAPYFLKVYGLTSRSSCPTTRPQLPILIITRPVRWCVLVGRTGYCANRPENGATL